MKKAQAIKTYLFLKFLDELLEENGINLLNFLENTETIDEYFMENTKNDIENYLKDQLLVDNLSKKSMDLIEEIENI